MRDRLRGANWTMWGGVLMALVAGAVTGGLVTYLLVFVTNSAAAGAVGFLAGAAVATMANRYLIIPPEEVGARRPAQELPVKEHEMRADVGAEEGKESIIREQLLKEVEELHAQIEALTAERDSLRDDCARKDELLASAANKIEQQQRQAEWRKGRAAGADAKRGAKKAAKPNQGQKGGGAKGEA